jgi:hypothetical protein
MNPDKSNLSLNSLPNDNKNVIIYEPHINWCCCTTYKDRSKFKNILQHLEISDVQKQIIESRYLNILENLQKRARNHSIVFFVGHFIITVGSLLVPALLSIQNSDKSFTFSGIDFNVQIYWTTFIISLLVTMWNGILTLFKIDKKYYFIHTTLERLRSEGWQYFGLTGRYSGHLTGNNKPTHTNQFVFFTHYIEKIKMKQIEEEYYKTDEKSSQAPTIFNQNGTVINTQSELYPPSPDKPITSMTQNIPEPIKDTLHSIIKSQNIIEVPKVIDMIPMESTIESFIESSTEKIPSENKNEIIIPITSPPTIELSTKIADHIVDTSKIVNNDNIRNIKSYKELMGKGIRHQLVREEKEDMNK